MAAKIVIKGGETYELPTNFTFREMNLVKRLTGLRAGELAEAFRTGDTDAMIAFAAVARLRATGDAAIDNLLDLEIGDVRIEDDGDETEDPSTAAAAAEEAEADA